MIEQKAKFDFRRNVVERPMANYSILIILFLAMLLSCCLSGCKSEKISPSDVAINQVIEKTVRDVNSLNIGYPLYLIGIGGGINHDTGKERMISISFQLHHPLSKYSCRWLLVTMTQIFLKNINENIELSQYLPEGGFTYKNVDVSFDLRTPERSPLYYPDIVSVFLYEGIVSYAKRDPEETNKKPRPYIEVLQEPYEEALKIVESQGRPDELKGSSSL